MSTSKLKTPQNLPMILLSMVGESSVTGYDLSKQVPQRWKASHQQIYRDLNRMAQRGDIVCHHEPQSGRPDKKIYSITEQGRKELLNMEVEDFVVTLPNLRHDSISMFQVENLSYFASSQALLKEQIKEIETNLNQRRKDLPVKDQLLMDRAVDYYSAELKFVIKAIAYIKGELNLQGDSQ